MTAFIMSSEEEYWLDTTSMSKDKYFDIICEYANLLLTPLSLSQFIPCNEKGEPMEKPESFEDWQKSKGIRPTHVKSCREYQKALDKVLFEGWVETAYGCYNTESGHNIHFYERYTQLILAEKVPESITMKAHTKQKWVTVKTVEDLISSEIELTPAESCRKMIGIPKTEKQFN